MRHPQTPASPGRKPQVLKRESFDQIAQRFHLLGEPTRLRILFHLGANELSVGEIVQCTGATQSNVSKHLAALHNGGIVHRRRLGTSVLYSVADPTIFDLCDIVCGGIEQALDHRRRAMR